MRIRPIHHTFGPLADHRQVMLAIKLLFQPWKWKNGNAREVFRKAIAKDLDGQVALFSSGREGLFKLLQALGIGNGDEVIVQAYTCIVVPNAIHATGAKTVYVDIERHTLNLDPEAVEKAITTKTKAIICQHTFGIPAPLSELRDICDRKNIPLIEDCAHILPDAKGPKGIATTGDYALLSFGRDKAISGVTGGAVVSRDGKVSALLRAAETAALTFSLFTIKRLLHYPLLYAEAKLTYGLGLGKACLALASKLHLLIPIVTTEEKRGHQPTTVHRLPNACAALALDQWKRRQDINDHRRFLTAAYLRLARANQWPAVAGACEGLPLQKFPLFLPNAEQLRRKLKKENIHLYDGWTGCVVCPMDVDASSAGYGKGDDPKAEEACLQILSLPTHPDTSVADAQTVAARVTVFLKNA